jgi:ATP-dependent DNA helicase RecG
MGIGEPIFFTIFTNGSVTADMSDLMTREIKFLPGVGPKRAELLNKELSIFTFGDLLYYFPYKYVDRSKFYKVREVQPDLPYIQLRGHFVKFEWAGDPRRKRLIGHFTDGSAAIELIWFQGTRWLLKSLKLEHEYVVFGKPSLYNNKVNIIHPEIEDAKTFEASLVSGLQAFYSTTEKLKSSFLTSKTLQKLQNTLMQMVGAEIQETLPEYLRRQLNLVPLPQALKNIHFPESPTLLKKAQYRLKFEELFYIQLNLLKLKVIRNQKYQGFVFSTVGKHFNHFYRQNLPFELTDAQKRVMKEIRKDLGSGKQMNRLLQGDVGSGKTLVALMSMLLARDNGYQSCLMAPTEILANQHYETLKTFLAGMEVTLRILTGSTSKSERTEIHQGLTDGTINILVGTHALIEETVQFRELGLVIIDEQHRFGVAQRARLWKKSLQVPHVLVMTATPIPRTLAMTLYGDLEVSVIDELPPGRKPIKTIHFFDNQRLRMHGFLREQIGQGRQVFIVYPLISESEKMDYKDLEDGYEGITRAFPPPKYAVSVVHGRMKTGEKEKAMKYFVRGQTHIMVATTVIEVGMDIPNASVMVIESAERFGLSQLHQLRGRVGRGADQSYCLLLTGMNLTQEARKRIDIMVRTNDGFEIAEVDLKLRGPGDLEGTQQSGIPFSLHIANLGKDGQILQYARDIAQAVIDKDPLLSSPENKLLEQQLKKSPTGIINWSVIS